MTKKLEAILLSFIYYRYDVKTNENFHWHMAISEVHDPREAHMHNIHTNHSQLIYASSNIKQSESSVIVNENFDAFRPLRYH